jgi:hypothetical protein
MTELKDIMALSGYPGLYKHIAQGRTGIIIESLIDGKRMNAYPSAKISSLEDIAVFTKEGEIKLDEVLRKIRDKEKGGAAIDPKSDKEVLLTYFTEVVPEFDRQRVYASDIKKIIGWYNLLQSKNMLDLLDKKEEPETVDELPSHEKAEVKTRTVKKSLKPETHDKEATKSRSAGKAKSPSGNRPLSK